MGNVNDCMDHEALRTGIVVSLRVGREVQVQVMGVGWGVGRISGGGLIRDYDKVRYSQARALAFPSSLLFSFVSTSTCLGLRS